MAPKQPKSMRFSIAGIIWFVGGWIFLIYFYISLSPSPSPSPNPQQEPSTSSSRLLFTLQVSDVEDDPLFSSSSNEGPLLTKRVGASNSNNGHGRPRPRTRWSSPSSSSSSSSSSSFNVSALMQRRASFLFPNKSFTIDPSYAEDMHCFYPGWEWRDTDGNPIQAHGGGVLFVPNTRTFYWYGENKDGLTYRVSKHSAARVDVIGVSCYSSKDLWTWKNEGIVLEAEKSNTLHDLYISNVLERPKVIYNDRTKQYVMWMHIDNTNYSKASIGVAISFSPIGPFRYLFSKQPHGCDSRDMTVFKDEDDGKAYLVYSSKDNSELHVGVLTDDYLDLRKGVQRRILIGRHREAPAVFKHRGLYYMVTSGCTSWSPNPALVHSSRSMLGPWESIGNPCVGGNEELRRTTFYSQGTFVLPIPGLPDVYLFMADRWNPTDLGDSRYVWLPLTMDGPADEPLDHSFTFPLWSRVSIRYFRKWSLPFRLSG